MKHKCEDYKISAVQYFLREKSQKKTCEIFNCKERSLMRWVKKYNETGNIKRKKRNYIAYKVKFEYVKYLKSKIKKNNTIKINDLTIKLNQKFNENLSKSQVYNIIKDNNITLKQTKIRHEPELRYKKPVDIKKHL